MIKFSVIVPVYNCARYLMECVNSVLTQTLPDFELLLVDDGSTDGSADLCDRFASEDTRVRVFHKPNGGAASARNVGLENASGEYVLFIDGDDTVEPDLLEQFSLSMDGNEIQMALFGMAFDYYNADGELERTEYLSTGHRGIVAAEAMLVRFSEYFADNALSSACNKVFSSALICQHSVRFTEDMTLYEDMDFVLQYLRYCKQILCLDRVFYHYRLFLQAPHFHQRVSNLNRLQENLESLTATVLELNSPEAAQQTADLCSQLFDQHLMTAGYSKAALSGVSKQIVSSSALALLSQMGAVPSFASSPSWNMLCSGKYKELYHSLKKRRRLQRVKRTIKPILRKIGLYH